MKIPKIKLLLLPLSVITMLGLAVLFSPLANAASLSVTVSTVGACVSTTNGSGNSSMNVVTGSNVSLTVFNDDLQVSQLVSGPGVAGNTVVQKNNKASTQDPITLSLGTISSQVVISFTPIPTTTDIVSTNYCPLGSTPVASSLTINPVAAPAPPAAPKATPTASTPATTTPAADTPTATTTPESTTPTTPDPEVAALAASITSSSNMVAKPVSTTTKVLAGVVAVALIGLLVASLTGHVPYGKFWHSLQAPFKSH